MFIFEINLKKRIMKIYKHLPNFITLLNLSMGLMAIYLVLEGGEKGLAISGYFIFMAAVFDFFDGFSARLLNAKSEIGLQLDSLADMVSFGAAPGFILFKLIMLNNGDTNNSVLADTLVASAILIPWGAALRLAKFNIDETQQTGFKGMPTPAFAFFVASLPIIRSEFAESGGMVFDIINNVYFLSLTAVAGFFLMTGSFPMFALKFKGFGWKGNEVKYIFILLSLILIIILKNKCSEKSVVAT